MIDYTSAKSHTDSTLFYHSAAIPAHMRNGNWEDISMNRRNFAFALSIGAAFLLAPGLAFAADHLAEAISHTKEAIATGEQGRVDMLVTHAEAALKHAEAGEKAKSNTHTEEAIKHLEAAIEAGKKNDGGAATGHAKEALTHLEEATK